jgi:hypothetical protein
MAGTEELIVALDGKIVAFRQKGADTDGLEKGLFAVRNRFHSLFHNVDVARVNTETASIRADLAKLQQILKGLDDTERQRKLAGAAAIVLPLLAALFCYLLKGTYD